MENLAKRALAFLLMLTITCATAIPSQLVEAAGSTGGEDGITLQADEAVPTVTYTCVHDPSIVVGYIDGTASSYTNTTKVYGVQNTAESRTEIYFIFGSHKAWSYSFDLMNWKSFTNNISTDYDTIFAEDATWSALGGIQDSKTGKYEVSGNLWAPDIVWNPTYKNSDGTLGAWCMYMSVNGDSWYSSIVLLTASSLNGNWTRQGPVVYSGFRSEAEAKKTDYFSVVDGGTNQKIVWNDRYKYNRNGSLTYGMNAIDPCVFYDEDGNLWMSYGSWFGGLYLLRMDQENGLRDYSYTYKTDFDDNNSSYNVRTDAYQGIHIAGGNHASGEASYIEYINGYYYLFVSLGGFEAAKGYNMRVFRSETVDGSYKDTSGKTTYGGYKDASGDSAVYESYKNNVNADIGMRLMTYYKWNYMDYGYTAEGHNSAFVDVDGKVYVIYHTRTNDGTEGHEVRVHQLFVTESGWLAAAPFEYTGESLVTDSKSSGYLTEEDVAGAYEVILQKSTKCESLECNEGTNYQLKEDGTVTAGSSSGTWSWSESKGAPYATITIGGETYEGVFLKQRMEASTAAAASINKPHEAGEETVVFTMIGKTGEIPMWGYKYVGDDQKIAADSAAGLDIPSGTFLSILLPDTCANGATVKWKSGNTAIMSDTGVVVSPEEDTTVTMTATVTYGTATAKQDYEIMVYAPQVSGESKVIAKYFTGSSKDLTNAGEGTNRYDNPFLAKNTFGLQAYNGVSIKFDLKRTSTTDPWLKDIFEFGTGSQGGLYFDGNSYLGYNATGGIFDANLRNGTFPAWGWGTDYLNLTSGKTASVEIQILPTGYSLSVNGQVAYTQDDIEPYESGKTEYKTPGQNAVDSYSNVLGYLLSTATQLNFGWGDWWDGGYPGTISNVVLSALPVEIEDHSDYTFYEDFNGLAGTSGNATGFISKDSPDDVSVVYSADQYGYYLNFVDDSKKKNSRGVYKDFGLNGNVTGNYTFEVDVKMTAANNQTSSFEILGADSSAIKTPNDAVSSNYILKLTQTDANKTTYAVNNGDTTVTIPNDIWTHIKVAVDDDMNVYADIGGTLVKTTADGNTTLYGLHFRRGRYTGALAVDNMALKTSFTCIHSDEDRTTSSEKVDPTCTEPGGYKVVCSICGWISGNGNIPALGHQHTKVINVIKATCTTDGYTGDTYCEDCKQTIGKGETVTALGHDMQADTSREGSATCTESGVGYYKCSRCSETEEKQGQAALDHLWDTGTVKTAATCVDAGVKVFTCTRACCKDDPEAIKTETIPATGKHTYDTNGVVKTPATCTKKGVTTYKCTGCNATKDIEDIDMIDHNYVAKVTKEATTSSEGTMTYTCSVCQDSYTKTIPKLTQNGGNTTGGDTVKKGASYTVRNLVYKVTDVSKKTVTVTGIKKSKKNSIKTITIGKTVKIKGKSYKVTAIANNAFANCKKLTKVTIGANVTKIGKKAFYKDSKLKNIVVKTKKLKSVGSSALKGINKKATIKVPASKLKKYKTLFKKKGQSSKVKIKK